MDVLQLVSIVRVNNNNLGESIPIRLFLSGYDLTPTYKNILNLFSVKYNLNIILVDETDRRYFQRTELSFWRKDQRDEDIPLHNIQQIRIKNE